MKNDFTLEELQFIGKLVVWGFIPMMSFIVWFITWRLKVDQALDVFGEKFGTEKGLDRMGKRRLRKQRNIERGNKMKDWFMANKKKTIAFVIGVILAILGVVFDIPIEDMLPSDTTKTVVEQVMPKKETAPEVKAEALKPATDAK
jgi:hypothetical protein